MNEWDGRLLVVFGQIAWTKSRSFCSYIFQLFDWPFLLFNCVSFFQGAHLVVRPFDTSTDDTSFCYNANRFGIGIKLSRHSRSHQQQTSSSLNRKRNPLAISFRHIHIYTRSSDCPLTHFLISSDEANIVLRSELMVYCKTFSLFNTGRTHTADQCVCSNYLRATHPNNKVH
jgi:hypothetical protein